VSLVDAEVAKGARRAGDDVEGRPRRHDRSTEGQQQQPRQHADEGQEQQQAEQLLQEQQEHAQQVVTAAQLRIERELNQARIREQRSEARIRRLEAVRAAAAEADARFTSALLTLASRAHFSFLTPRDVQLAASLNQDYWLGGCGAACGVLIDAFSSIAAKTAAAGIECARSSGLRRVGVPREQHTRSGAWPPLILPLLHPLPRTSYRAGNIFIRTNPAGLDPSLAAACPEARAQMPPEAEPLLVFK
jgi:hypothetical protein